MTVNLRQLVKTAGVSTPPPIPPPVATMSFVQQPTNTFVNQLMLPPPSVQISDGASDSLTIFSPTCDIGPVTVTADSTGFALFTGLLAGPTAASACHLIVHNNTRSLADITSLPFQLLPPVIPVPSWQLIASAIAVNEPDQLSSVSVTINSLGANVLVLMTGAFNVPVPTLPIDSAGNVWTNAANLASNLLFSNYRNQTFIMINPLTSAVHTITRPNTTGNAEYNAMAVFAFSAVNPVVILSGASFTNGHANTTTIAPATPLPVGNGDLVLSSCTADGPYVLTQPAGYTAEIHDLDGSLAIDLGGAFRIFNAPSVESPTWTLSTPFIMVTTAAALHADLI